MIASRFFSLSVVVLSAFGISAAGPVQRGTTDVQTVITTLKTSTDSILPQIGTLRLLILSSRPLISVPDGLVSAGNATESTITPLLTGLTSAFDSASSSLASLPGAALANGETEQKVAQLVASVVTVRPLRFS